MAWATTAGAGAGQAGLVPGSLLQKASAHGSVRVIVQLAVPAVPEGHLPDGAAVSAQRHDIVLARGALA
jgi:hypothetical protein